KVIFENCYLTDDQKVRLCRICGEVGADYAKTSTGFGTGGATDHDLILMRQAAPPHVQLKAAGGVRPLHAPLPAPPPRPHPAGPRPRGRRAGRARHRRKQTRRDPRRTESPARKPLTTAAPG